MIEEIWLASFESAYRQNPVSITSPRSRSFLSSWASDWAVSNLILTRKSSSSSISPLSFVRWLIALLTLLSITLATS